MAMYICPEVSLPGAAEMMEGMPCSEMDKQKPVHCAQFQSGDEIVLEHSAPTATLVPLTLSSVILVLPRVTPPVVSFGWLEAPSESSQDPPYLRTQRLRI